jgi:hypothetical protein
MYDVLLCIRTVKTPLFVPIGFRCQMFEPLKIVSNGKEQCPWNQRGGGCIESEVCGDGKAKVKGAGGVVL